MGHPSMGLRYRSWYGAGDGMDGVGGGAEGYSSRPMAWAMGARRFNKSRN